MHLTSAIIYLLLDCIAADVVVRGMNRSSIADRLGRERQGIEVIADHGTTHHTFKILR